MSMEEASFLHQPSENVTEYTLITQVGEDGMHHATILQQVGEDGSGPTVVQLEQLPAGTQEQIQAQLVQSLVQNGQLHQQVMVEQPSTTLELLPSVSMGEVHEVPVTMPVVSIGMANEPDAIVESPVPVSLPRPSDVKPPVGKGPFKCDVCGKMLQRWAQLQRHLRQHEDDKPFRCNQCDLTFNVEDNLHLHMAIHNTDNPMCPECGKKFSRIASLKAHIMLHEREENVMCPECGDEFPVQSQLDRHIQEHREEQEGTRVYPCKQCGMEFSKLTLLREHMKVHYKIRNSLHHRSYKRQIDRTNFHHKCKYCGKTFLKPSQLDRHVRIHTGERPYKCSICEKAFNQKGALQIHMSKHTGDRPFSCDFCPMTFAQRGNLRAHILRVHSHPKDSDAPVYQCEECSCAFKKLGSLNAHVSRTHSDPQTIKVPNEPQKETIVHKQNVNDVIQHLLEMSEQVPDAATAAGAQNITEQNNSDILRQALENSGLPSTQKEGQQSMTTTPVTMDTSSINTVAASSSAPQLASVTGTPGTLSGGYIESQTVTMSIHDSATGTVKKHVIRKVNGVRWHQCMYCSKEFKKPSDLVRHIRIHTHEKPYKCNQCFRAFAVKSTLTAHLKTHTGIKEFKCHVCDKHFATQGSLKVHLRLHTGAKPFDCPHCDKKFRTSGHRKSHIQSHFKSPELEKGGKRLIRRASKPDIPLPDIPLQEPILITDTGLIQQPPRQNQIFSHYLGEVGSVDRPYKCQTCLRSFKKSSHLKQHIRSHTGEKPYQCLQCLKSFVSSGVLKAHIRTHSGVKAYKCLICNSTFTTSGSLKRHMSTHSEVRPFMCPYCQKTFKTSVNCKKHMKTHRHDLALQAMQQDDNIQPGSEGAEVTEAPEETVEHVTHDNNTITLQTVATDDDGTTTTTEITTVPQEAQLETDNLGQEQTLQQTVQQELTQELTNTTLTQQNVIQEAIVDQQLTNTLGTQNGFGQQQTLNQTLLGGSQAFSDLNLSSGQFTIQGIQTSLDVGGLVNLSQQVSGINTSMASTSMQNILQTSDTQSQQQQTTYRASENIPLDIPDGKRNYNCDLCKKSFKKSSHLKAHLRTHTGEKPYNCIQCGRKFVSMGVLKAHLKTHTGMKEHICTVCQASFTTNGSLTRHMMIHSSVRPFQCPICQERFRTLTLCKRHIKGHKDGDDDMDKSLGRRSRPVITLSEEQAEQLSRAPLDEHMSVSEQILIQSAAEKDRISEIPGPTSVDKHPKFPHQCQHCPKSFKKPSDLVRHVRIHTGEKPYSCDTCGRSFTVKSTLETHLLTHKGTEKRFKCHVCSSAFSTKGSLKVHMRLHTGAKPFKCPHCDQKFRTSGHRKSHIAAHFRTETPKKRRTSVRGSELQNEINNTAGNAQAGGVLPGMDQALLQNQSLIPVSLSLGDQLSALTDSTATTQMLQGLEGVQLQLTGAVGQGIQITGLDPSLITQTVQIDASLLQQLQQQGNLNITINPSILTADPNLVQQSALQPDPSNNVLIQPVAVAPVGQEVVSDAGPGQPMLSMTSDQAVGQEVTADQDTDVVVPEGVSEDTLDHLDNPGIIVSSSSQANHRTVGQEPMLTQSGSMDIQQIPIQINGGNVVDGTVRVLTDRKHSCPVCHKAFKRAGHLKDHMVMHNPEDVKQQVRPTPHKCKFCEKAFHKPSQLERHTRIHTGERPFVCEICDKAFNQKNALQIHLKKHSGERPHRCNYCGMAFTQKGNLKIHIKRLHHKDMVDSMNLSAASAAAMVDGDSSLTHSFTAHDSEAQGQGDTTTDLDGVVTEFLLHE